MQVNHQFKQQNAEAVDSTLDQPVGPAATDVKSIDGQFSLDKNFLLSHIKTTVCRLYSEWSMWGIEHVLELLCELRQAAHFHKTC